MLSINNYGAAHQRQVTLSPSARLLRRLRRPAWRNVEISEAGRQALASLGSQMSPTSLSAVALDVRGCEQRTVWLNVEQWRAVQAVQSAHDERRFLDRN